MKRLILLLINAIGSCMLPSCTYYFELDEIAEVPKLTVFCYPGSGDTTVIRLSGSTPVCGDYPPSNEMTHTEAHLWINGKPVNLTQAARTLPGVPANSFYTLHPCREGDRIELTASASRLQPVSASTTVPKAFPLKSTRLIRKDSGTMQYQVTFSDDGSTDNYYAVMVERKQRIWRNNVYSEQDEATYLQSNEEPLFRQSGLDEIFIGNQSFYQNLYYWGDEKIQGKDYTLHLSFDSYQDSDDIYDYGDTQEHVVCKYQYRLVLYTLSKEFYLFLKTINNQENNDLADVELAPKRPTYTNVNNGLGIVGGCTLYRTEWTDNLKNE